MVQRPNDQQLGREQQEKEEGPSVPTCIEEAKKEKKRNVY